MRLHDAEFFICSVLAGEVNFPAAPVLAASYANDDVLINGMVVSNGLAEAPPSPGSNSSHQEAGEMRGRERRGDRDEKRTSG